jgi:hypothetical protein
MLIHDGQRLSPIGGGEEPVSVRRKHDLQQLSIVRFIIHDENAR